MIERIEQLYLERGEDAVAADPECQAALAADPQLRAEWQRVLTVDAALAALPSREMPESVARHVLAEARLPARLPFFRRRRDWGNTFSHSLAFASALMLIALLPLTISLLTASHRAELTVLELGKFQGAHILLPWQGGGGFAHTETDPSSRLSFHVGDAQPVLTAIAAGHHPVIRDPLALYNAFSYASAGAGEVAATSELAECPWNSAHRLLRVQVEAHRAFAHLSVRVDFSADKVARYRLIGSETPIPMIAASESAANGARVVALYELEMNAGAFSLGDMVVDGDASLRVPLASEAKSFSEASNDFRFTAAVALFVLEERGTKAESTAATLATNAAANRPERLAFAGQLRRLR